MANLGNNIDSMGGSDINDLLDISDLTYLATPESNVVMSRRQKTQSLNEKYVAGEIISFIIETGQDYVSWQDSTLNFTLELERVAAGDPTVANFGGGSALNLLNRITITTASGDKITTLSKANLWNYYNDKIKHSYEWQTQQGGKILGYESGNLAVSTKWVIPLSSICEFFAIDVLTPNVVANGLKIDIELEAVSTAFVDASAAADDRVSKYTVVTPEIRLDHYTLSGGAMNALNSMSATSGLVLNYQGVRNSPFNKGEFSKFTNKVSDGLAMVSSAWTVIRDVPGVDEIKTDSFKTRNVLATDKYKYRLGSTNLPEEDIVGPEDWYNQVLYATGSLKHGKELGVRFDEFKDHAMAVASIDRYWTAGSGMAINQSTSLSITATVLQASAVVDTFVVHQTRSVSFLESTSVFE
jgi:hypothetical protein